jgi:hypothetical protein
VCGEAPLPTGPVARLRLVRSARAQGQRRRRPGRWTRRGRRAASLRLPWRPCAPPLQSPSSPLSEPRADVARRRRPPETAGRRPKRPRRHRRAPRPRWRRYRPRQRAIRSIAPNACARCTARCTRRSRVNTSASLPRARARRTCSRAIAPAARRVPVAPGTPAAATARSPATATPRSPTRSRAVAARALVAAALRPAAGKPNKLLRAGRIAR